MVIICIAICKPIKAEIPSMETFKQCFTRNRDGAGVTWLENGKLYIEKGFMKFEDFENFIKQLQSRIDVTNTLMGFHFRIKTHGEVSKENTHPFPVSTNMTDLKQLSFETDGKVAIHNGIISKFDGTLKNSDTQEFIAEFLAPLNNGVPNWETNEHLVKLVEHMLGSKMCVFNTDGTFKILGTGWIEDNGVWYSNSTYKSYGYSYGRYSYGNYNYFYDDEDDYCLGYQQSKKQSSPILSSQEEKLLNYIDTNNIILLDVDDYINKKYEHNILNNSINVVIALDKDGYVYQYDLHKRVFVKKPRYRAIDVKTLKPLEFNSSDSLFEVIG